MLRVAAPEFLPHLGVAPFPEAGQILGDLHGPTGGGEQLHDHGPSAPQHPGALLEAEQLLELHGQNGFAGAVIKSGEATGGDRHLLR